MPIVGKTLTFKIDGTTVTTSVTDSKGKFSVTMPATSTSGLTPGKHDVQVSFPGDSQYNPSSMTKKLTVVTGTSTLTITSAAIDSSLSLKVDGKDKMAGGADFTVSGKLIDSVSKKPISGKEISVTTDGDSGTDITNSKGEFEVDLKAPDNAGKYDINAQFAGDSQYKSSDSTGKITVEEPKVNSQKATVTTNPQNTDEEQTGEETEEQQEEDMDEPEEQPEEEQTDEPEEEPEGTG